MDADGPVAVVAAMRGHPTAESVQAQGESPLAFFFISNDFSAHADGEPPRGQIDSGGRASEKSVPVRNASLSTFRSVPMLGVRRRHAPKGG